MVKFFLIDNRLEIANGEYGKDGIDEKQAVGFFADNLRELRAHCKLSLLALSDMLDIPNQTLSSYENKKHIPSMMQAIKIASFFRLTVEEFILCGLDEYPYDVIELYEKRKER